VSRRGRDEIDEPAIWAREEETRELSATVQDDVPTASESESKGKPAKKRRRDKRSGKKAGLAPARQIKFARFLGLVLCGAGFLLIILGWAGAARRSCIDCQIPYLLSGGAAGLGLILFGVTIVVMAQLRTDSRRLADRLDRLTALLAETWAPEEIEPEAEAPPVAASETAPEPVPGADEPAPPVQERYLAALGVAEEGQEAPLN
jgi:hypothetical protein